MKKVKRVTRRKNSSSDDDSLFIYELGIEKRWFEKTAELAKETEKKTGKLPIVVFSMFHGVDPQKGIRAWGVTDWTLENWSVVRDSLTDGFVPFAHITVIPYTNDFNDGKWIASEHYVVPEWVERWSYKKVQYMGHESLRLCDIGTNGLDFTDRGEIERQSKAGAS
jgi:hypothetical protein